MTKKNNNKKFKFLKEDNKLKLFPVYEDDEYLGMIFEDSTQIVDRLNKLHDLNEQLYDLLKKYREINDFLTIKLSDAVKQGFEVDFEELEGVL